MTKIWDPCIAAAILLGSIQIQVFAQNPKPGASPEATVQVLSATSDYWTPARRAAAIPREQLVDQVLQPLSSSAPTNGQPLVSVPGALPATKAGTTIVKRPGVETAAESMAYTYPYPFTEFPVLQLLYRTNLVYPYTTVGKLFFSFGAVDYVCSASVVRPHLLLTARHCVLDFDGQFASNVVFYPGYNGSSNLALGGAWVARRLYTWVSNPFDFAYDIGFVQLYDDSRVGCNGSAGGKPIETYTGFLGYSYGGTYHKRQWNQFGYPQVAPFTGKVLIESQSSTGAEDSFGFIDTVEVGNSQTGGASGGPWIRHFKPGFAGAVNYANGINSFKYVVPAHPQAINGPKFFEYNFNQLLIGAQKLPCK